MMQFDLLIKNALIHNGRGDAPFVASVGIIGDTITFIGDVEESNTSVDHVIDATGHVLSPGFIDSHTHDDAALLFNEGKVLPKVSQGVTTVIAGNCGISLAPFDVSRLGDRPFPEPLNLLGDLQYWRFRRVGQYVAEVEAHPATLNVAFFVGHMNLRFEAMGLDEAKKRPASPDEINHMKALLEEGLQAGALGLSTGLWYPPNSPATTDEVVALTDVVSRFKGIYATHMRHEDERMLAAVQESLEIGKRSRVPVVISHHKVTGRKNFGAVQESLKLIEDALAQQQVCLDVYPYHASSTILHWPPPGADVDMKVFITWSRGMPDAGGKYLSELVQQYGLPLYELVEKLKPAGAAYFCMDETDVQTVLKSKHSMIGSDGLFFDAHPHPRLWGTFPRVLGLYSREQKLFDLSEAIRKMTSLPAHTYGLAKRGQIECGYFADIVIFDAKTISSDANFDKPCVPATGIKHVIVNGKVVYNGDNFTVTEHRPGRVLRRSPNT